MITIKGLTIDGLRGVRSQVSFDLSGKSLLLYGENGSGKSCVADAIEWFLFNKVGHLASEEISALEALRNIFLGNDDKGSLTINFSKAEYNSVKSVYLKKGNLTGEHSNRSPDFTSFLKEVGKENFILRYRDLVSFVIAPKKEKLDKLSDIIGFSEVTSVREVLKKMVNSHGRDLRSKGFETQIAVQQRNILEQIGQNITEESQFFAVIDNLVAPLGVDRLVTKMEDVDSVLAAIKQPTDEKAIAEQTLYSQIHDLISNLSTKIDDLLSLYSEYRERFRIIADDIEKLKKIAMEGLLQSGLQVLYSGAIQEGLCPLCLQPKNTSDLMNDLIERIAKLTEYKKEIEELSIMREAIKKEIVEWSHKIQTLSSNATLASEENGELRVSLEGIKATLDLFLSELKIEFGEGKSLKHAKDIVKSKRNYDEVKMMCTDRNEKLKATRKDDVKFEAHSKIVLTQKALTEIQRLKKEKGLIERRKSSLELIYAEFARRQKQALEIFLSRFSGRMNEYYQFMNANEKVEDIRLIPIENNDELSGITIGFKFHDSSVSPPHKYLSESHLNCLGIAFFLASVKAFNKMSRCLVLDDVISSFDTNHRKRLADLLLEKFSDHQLIVLTHERNWYEYLANSVRDKDWKVNIVKWDADNGTYIDEPTQHVKARIESKLKSGSFDGVGNEIRKYLEHVLKEIAFNLEVKVRYLFNETNEDRMAYELLTELKAKIKKHAGSPLKGAAVMDRLLSSSFIANKDSHDSTFIVEGGDLRATWKDVKELEDLFYCAGCGRCISIRHYDDVNKFVRCGCKADAAKNSEWKR